ncbi:MAG TPA: VanW family protein [Enhygromyxa sp.]|nr:VanW family protein [Enhygromyxa sp.]
MTELEPLDLAVHRLKVQAHRALRWLDDRRAPIQPARASRLLIGLPRVAEDRSPLWNRDVDPREWPLELGKVENLRVAARSLDGLELEAEQLFSFWAQVGPPLRVRGFVPGRELREGCVMPGIGGGLCLLSNALFAAAKQAGLTIVERHPHSRRPPGSRAALGEDATVAWNYVDLRFVHDAPWRLEVELEAEALVVGIRRGFGDAPKHPPQNASRLGGPPGPPATLRVATRSPRIGWSGDAGASCLSCDQPCDFARKPDARARIDGRRTWLLDGVWPEYADYLHTHARADDRLAVPIDGERLRLDRYAWPRVGTRVSFPIHTVVRSLRSRQLASQGPARQRALLDDERRLARAMADTLSPNDTELVVAQNLLPHLRRLGALGGRRVTVLMTRLPLVELQAQLDQAHRRWPQSPTLADFRADARLLEDEAHALELAVEIVTPHAGIAGCFADKVTKLDWSLPAARARPSRPRAPGPLRLWLPASTVGRKGVHELRVALREVGPCQLWVAGRELEGPRFWPDALRVEHGSPGLERIDAVVLPAWIEHQPRELLRAVAAKVPVIASHACGLAGLDGVRTIATGDVAELRAAIVELRDAIDSENWVEISASGIGCAWPRSR